MWDKLILTIRIDEPWNGNEELRLPSSRIASKDPESRRARERRISDGWEKNGGIEVETETGKRWVHKAEFELAKRARDMAGITEMDERPDSGPTPDLIEPTNAPDPGITLGFFELWGKHLAVIALAAALAILVVWTLMLK